MIRLSDMAKYGRKLRQDDWDDLGRPTTDLVTEAIEAGDAKAARDLTAYIIPESKGLHDLLCDWLWDVFTQIAERHGEEEMHRIMRATQSTWMLKRMWKAFVRMPVEERVQLSAEILRAHHGGPRQQGELDIVDEGDRYTIYMNPCGSGGRMRRGDPVDGTPSRLGPPYNFGVTREAHDWSWGMKDVPYYCIHCCLNEKLPIEWGGHPLWVTGYDPDAAKPCAWHFYKSADAIPEHFYRRVGATKPKPGEGQY